MSRKTSEKEMLQVFVDGSPVTYAIHSRPHFVADVRGLRRAKVGAVVLFHTTLKTGPFVFLLICKDHFILLVLSHKFLYNKLIKQRRDEGERAMGSIDLIIGMRVGPTLGDPIEEIWLSDVIWFESGREKHQQGSRPTRAMTPSSGILLLERVNDVPHQEIDEPLACGRRTPS